MKQGYFYLSIDGTDCGAVPYSVADTGARIDDGNYGAWEFFYNLFDSDDRTEEVSTRVNSINTRILQSLHSGDARGEFDSDGFCVRWRAEEIDPDVEIPEVYLSPCGITWSFNEFVRCWQADGDGFNVVYPSPENWTFRCGEAFAPTTDYFPLDGLCMEDILNRASELMRQHAPEMHAYLSGRDDR